MWLLALLLCTLPLLACHKSRHEIVVDASKPAPVEFRFTPGIIDPSFSPPSTIRDEGIFEAVVQYELKAPHRVGADLLAPIFLEVAKTDPSPTLLELARKHNPTIAPVSQYGQGAGLIIFIGAVRFRSASEVLVYGGTYTGPWASEGLVYTVVESNGTWSVSTASRQWVS
jgi:hypothetical protein